ncbi:MAG: hypothetical protein OXH09_18230 [Gammaproteobacteria bacterium]|nr:hypothetical protein [Gammaproteobacteria bacterium]
MTRIERNEAALKALFKKALVETLREHRNLLRSVWPTLWRTWG